MARPVITTFSNIVKLGLLTKTCCCQRTIPASSPLSIVAKRTNEEFIRDVTRLLKNCRNWNQVYRLYKLTKNKLGWTNNSGGQMPGIEFSQLILSIQFDLAIISAQLN
jgi:hypothetical protein